MLLPARSTAVATEAILVLICEASPASSMATGIKRRDHRNQKMRRTTSKNISLNPEGDKGCSATGGSANAGYNTQSLRNKAQAWSTTTKYKAQGTSWSHALLMTGVLCTHMSLSPGLAGLAHMLRSSGRARICGGIIGNARTSSL